MQDTLLWVYEGQTQFWGWVLAARSGLQKKETVLGMFANAVASCSKASRAAHGAAFRTRPTIRSSIRAARCRSARSGRRITTSKAR